MSDKPRPTLGSKGFQKRQLVETATIAVNPNEIQAMTQGYETRIARQVEALGRMADLLEQRTQDVAEHMRRANEMAATVAEGNLGAMPTEPTELPLGQQIDRLQEYFDTQEYLTEVAATKLGLVLADGSKLIEMARAIVLRFVSLLDESHRNLAQAVTDAKNNARIANQSMKASQPNVGDISDETPPWQQTSFTAPAEIERTAGLPVAIDVAPDRETLSWPGMNDLEDRPGNSF